MPEVKQKLLEIHRLSLFSTFTPQQTFTTLNELSLFRSSSQGSRGSSSLDDTEHYDLLELEFYLSLISGKDSRAQTCLDRLIDKFDDVHSQRIALLKSTFLQATKTNGQQLAIDYLSLRSPEETNSVKKRVSLLRSVAKPEEYIDALNGFLDVCPLDTETWAELGESYFKVGHLDKAVHCYHEVLLQQSFNYYAFARIGELEHASFVRDGDVDKLESSIRHYLRAVELCSNFVRAWAGVFITTRELKEFGEQEQKKKKPSKQSVKGLDHTKLHDLAKNQLEGIIKSGNATNADLEAAKKIIA